MEVVGKSEPSLVEWVAEDERQLQLEQLRVIEKTSVPGVAACGVGGLGVVAYALLWPAPEDSRGPLLVVAAFALAMAGVWSLAIWFCRTGNIRGAFTTQLIANAVVSAFIFIFIERGAVLAMLAAFVGMSVGAMIVEERALRLAGALTAVVVLGAAGVHEMQLVTPIVLPPILLYSAVAVGVIAGFRTPVDAFRMFGEHLKLSRDRALASEQDLRRERDRADAHARELRDLSHVVSHDLRAPLINIEGFSAVLHDAVNEFDEQVRDSDEKTKSAWDAKRVEIGEALHFIAGGTNKMGSLISGLLELARIETKPSDDQAVLLNPLLEEIEASIKHQIRERDIELAIDPLPTIFGDPLRVGQVFGNLIDNAVKYMPERAPRTIQVSCDQGEDAFEFAVSDSGHGIPEESRDAIFRPFKQIDPGGGAVGDGLGLAAVKKIVERSGGRIWVEDAPTGPGASFRFTWPR